MNASKVFATLTVALAMLSLYCARAVAQVQTDTATTSSVMSSMDVQNLPAGRSLDLILQMDPKQGSTTVTANQDGPVTLPPTFVPPAPNAEVKYKQCTKGTLNFYGTGVKIPCAGPILGSFRWGSPVTIDYSLLGASPVSLPNPDLPSPYTFQASFLGGFTNASNFSNASGLEGDVVMYLGPVGFGAGGVRSGDSTLRENLSSSTGSSTGSTPGSTSQSSPTAHFSGAEVKGIVRVVNFRGFNLFPQGGVWLFTAHETSSFTVISTGPTGTITEQVTRNRQQGGNAPFLGLGLEKSMPAFGNHLATRFEWKRGYLRSGNSLDQGVNLFLFGFSVYPTAPRSIVNIGGGAR